MKKFFLWLCLVGFGCLAFVQAYLPRATDSKLIWLMLDNIEQLIEAKWDRVADVSVETMKERMDRELNERKLYILWEVIDRLSIEYDIQTTPTKNNDDDTIITEEEKMWIKVEKEEAEPVVVKKPVSQPVVKQSAPKTPTKVQPTVATKTPTPTPQPAVVKKPVVPPVVQPVVRTAPTMTITMYRPKTWTCDAYVQTFRQVPRTTAFLETTLVNLLSWPMANEWVQSTLWRPLKLLDVRLEKEIAFVNLPADFLVGISETSCTAQNAVDMLNLTVMWVKGVRSVVYAIEWNVGRFYYETATTTLLDWGMEDLQNAFDLIMSR